MSLDINALKFIVKMTPKPQYAHAVDPMVAVSNDVASISVDVRIYDYEVFPMAVTGPALTNVEIQAIHKQAQYLREEEALTKQIVEHKAAGLRLEKRMSAMKSNYGVGV